MRHLAVFKWQWWIVIFGLALVLGAAVLTLTLLPIERYYNTVLNMTELDTNEFTVLPSASAHVKLGMPITLRVNETYYYATIQNIKFDQSLQQLVIKINNLNLNFIPYAPVEAQLLLGTTSTWDLLVNL